MDAWEQAAQVLKLNSKQQKILELINSKPTPKNIHWDDIESLLRAVGCEIIERKGSHVSVKYLIESKDGTAKELRTTLCRPHPNKEALPYQVKKVVNFLTQIRHLP